MKKLFFILISVSLFSCSSNQEEQTTDSFQLPDSLFAFENLENTLFADNMFWDPKDDTKVYIDSTTKKAYIKLDSLQKKRLILPITDIDSNYVIQYMDAFFVSKQKMIGEFTPITIYLYGDDYAALLYILLDKSLKPISHSTVNGGHFFGPIEGDNKETLPPILHTFFKDDKFYSYSLTETIILDSIDHPSIFDSVSYESNILSSGAIQTKRIDSVRFERMPKE